MTVLETFENATVEERIQGIKELLPDLKVLASKNGVGYNRYGCFQKFRVTLEVGGRMAYFTFSDSIANYSRGSKSSKLDMLYAILMDATAYDSYPDLYEFAEGFGYGYEEQDMKTARKAYKGCERAYEVLQDFLGNDGYETLKDIFDNY